MITVNYPISLESLKKLKNGDKILYSGKIILVTPEALKRLNKYYQLEGVPLFNFLGEIVTCGTLNLAHGEIKNIDVSKISEYFEFLFSGGTNSLIVDKISNKTLNLLTIYKRPIFKTLEKTINCENSKVLFYKDIKNGGIIECWTKRHPIEIISFENYDLIGNINNA